MPVPRYSTPLYRLVELLGPLVVAQEVGQGERVDLRTATVAPVDWGVGIARETAVRLASRRDHPAAAAVWSGRERAGAFVVVQVRTTTRSRRRRRAALLGSVDKG
jgi:hypothetical protein